MAGVVKNLMVRAGADFSAITKQSKKAAGSMKEMQTSVCRSCNLMSSAATGLKKIFGALGVGISVAALVNFSKAAAEAYDTQVEGEMRLARVMRNTMNASNEEIQSILDLTAAQQELGIVGDEVQLAGAQELATYLEYADSLRTLIPVLNNMAVQQYGYNVTAEQTATIATMLGKVMSGQVSGLSRYGYYFTEAQEAVLKYGTEAERAAMLAEVVGQSVGGMNAALAATPTGRMKQLSNTLGDIKETFGRAVRTISTTFLPILNAVASVLAAVATVANKVAQTIANVFGGQVAGKEWQYVPPGTAAAAEDAAEGMDDLAKSTEKAGKAAKNNLQQASFDTLHILADNSKDASAATSDASSGSSGGGSSSGAAAGLMEMNTGVEAAGEGIGWLQSLLEKFRNFASNLDFGPLQESFGRLKESVAPLVSVIVDGLGWAWENILVPLAQWTISEALPAFFDLLGAAISVVVAVLEKLKPLAGWLWENFLQPIAAYVGDKFVQFLREVADGLQKLADLISGKISFREWLAELTPLEKALLAVGAAIAAVKLAALGMEAIVWLKNLKNLELGSTLIGKLGQVIALTAGGAGTLKEAMAAVFGPNSVLAGVGALIGGIVLALTSFVDQWENGMSLAKEAVMAVGLAIAAVGLAIMGVPGVVAAAIAAAIFFIATAVLAIKDNWEEISAAAAHTWEGIKSGAKAAIDYVVNAFKRFVNNIISMFEAKINYYIKGINMLISLLNKISIDIPDWIPLIGGKHFGFNIKSLDLVQLPRLATGAVIPPNKEFAAILGDQTQGMNIETPEHLLREIIREESGNGALLDLLGDILQAIRSDRDVMLDDQRVGKVVKRLLGQQSRAAGYSKI